MLQTRVIPVLLLKGKGLVKTEKFKNPKYVGDPVNAIKIFNEKEVDELVFLDILASKNKIEPNYKLIKDFASECFMPVCYGGGINNIEQIKKIFSLGVEKIAINSHSLASLALVKEASGIYGSQSIVAAVDVKKSLFGKYQVYNHAKAKKSRHELIEFVKMLEQSGAGELLINNVDRDGTQIGYDFELLKTIFDSTNLPVVGCGGAGSFEDFRKAKDIGISGCGVGSMFVFFGTHRAVLISYPEYEKLKQTLGN